MVKTRQEAREHYWQRIQDYGGHASGVVVVNTEMMRSNDLVMVVGPYNRERNMLTDADYLKWKGGQRHKPIFVYRINIKLKPNIGKYEDMK